MGFRFITGLLLAGILLALGASVLQQTPGYMDADYYYAGALRLVSGQGGSEPYLWNYLNDPARLPAPSFSYWMPMTAFISAAGLWLFPSLGFWGARMGFIILAAIMPVLTAWLSWQLTRNTRISRLAGLLALFPGFYLAYLTTTDAFVVYMVLGILFFLVILQGSSAKARLWFYQPGAFLLGVLAGFFHLTRADGILWLAGGMFAVWLWWRETRTGGVPLLFISCFTIIVGYMLVMAPWFVRNIKEWNSLMPPGGSRTMWITEYEQTMVYPAEQLSFDHWRNAGLGGHLMARVRALGQNLQTVVAVQGGILLCPFILAGLWELRRIPVVSTGLLMWLLTLGVMTLIFPFAGGNGGFFHSGAALQPLLWAVAPVGVESLMLRYVHWRKLSSKQQMVSFMRVLVCVVAVLLTVFLYFQRVIGNEPGIAAWDASNFHYREVEQMLVELGAQEEDPVLVNNPPGYWVASERPALVIPFGDENMLLDVAHRYGARYLVLERNNPWQLADLYYGRKIPSELEHLGSVGSTRLYRISLLDPVGSNDGSENP